MPLMLSAQVSKIEDVLKEPFEKFATEAARHSESDTCTFFIAFYGKEKPVCGNHCLSLSKAIKLVFTN